MNPRLLLLFGFSAGAWLCLHREVRGEEVRTDDPFKDVPAQNTPDPSKPGESADRDLFSAVVANELETVNKLIAAGADPNVPQMPTSESPLQAAVRQQLLPMVKLLLKHGATPKAADLSGQTALHLAAAAESSTPESEANALEILRLLLAAGADVNVENNQEATPLSMAAGHDVTRVRLLLDAGAKLNGMAFRVAAARAQVEVLDELVKRGGKATDLQPGQQTLFHAMATDSTFAPEEFAQKGLVMLDKLLALKVPIDAVDADGNSALHLAAANGNKMLVHWLLVHHAKTHLCNNEGHTPLWRSMESGLEGVTVASLLREHGAQLDETNEGDIFEALMENGNLFVLDPLFDAGWRPRSAVQTLLRLARMCADTPVSGKLFTSAVQRLAPLAQDINSPDGEGFPLLIWCCRLGNEEAVRLLVRQRQIKLEQPDVEGRTALIWSGMVGNQAIREDLLQAGAKQAAKDHEGRTVDDYGKWSRFEAKPDEGSSPEFPVQAAPHDMFYAVLHDDRDLLRKRLREDAAAANEERGGLQPVHLAAALGRTQCFDMLLEAGVTGKMASGESVPWIAITHGQAKLAAQWMHRQGKEPQKLDVMMAYLAATWEGDRGDLAKGLFEAGVAPREYGWQCLRVAAASGDVDFCQKLLEQRVPLLRPASYEEDTTPLSVLEDAVRSHQSTTLALLLPRLKKEADKPKLIAALNRALVAACGEGNVDAVKMLLTHNPPAEANAELSPARPPYQPVNTFPPGMGNFAPAPPSPSPPTEDSPVVVSVRDPFINANYGCSPLEAAVGRNDLALLRLLCEHGAKLDTPEANTSDLLSLAIAKQHHEALEFMLAHHANLKSPPNLPSPLHTAASLNDERAVRALLTAGADSGAKDNNSNTAAELARSLGYDDVANLIDQVPPHAPENKPAPEPKVSVPPLMVPSQKP